MIKLVCIDIDGTLLDSKKNLPAENLEAVHYAMDHGAAVAIASGRSVSGIKPLIAELGIDRNGVCLNGGLILCDKVIHQTIMEETLVMKILEQAEKYKSQVFLSAAEFNITNGEVSPQLKELIEKGSLRSDYFYCTGYDELRREAHRNKDKIIKLAIKELDEENFDLLKQALIDLHLFHVVKSDEYFVDVGPLGVNKGKGVAILTDYLHIPMEQVMCIGDNENDLEMLDMAGIGVAMGNAVEPVKRAAVYVTSDNDHTGVAEAIYKFIK